MRLEKDAFAQIKPYFLAKNIDFENINQFVEILKICFGKVNLVGIAKHELYQLYQTIIDLEVFLNTFLQLSKKAKIDDSQVLDILNEKLSDEFKDWLVTIRKVKNFNNLILLLCDMDANMKKNNKQSQLYIKPNASNYPAIKPPFKLYNSVSTKLSTAIRIEIISSVPSTATGTHFNPINMSSVIKQGPILQKKRIDVIALACVVTVASQDILL